jgi:ATP-dependent helicase/nuclease subunit B
LVLRRPVESAQTLNPELSAAFDEAIAVVDDGMRKGCFPQVPGGETMRPGRTTWDNCVWCAYDRICPASRDQLAERKKGDEVAALHARLIPEVDTQ